MAKVSNFVTLPTADDALLWYYDYTSIPFPEDGTVIVRTEDGSGLGPINNYGIIFERQLINFGLFEGDANWGDGSEEVKLIQVGSGDSAYDVSVDSSYDDQDENSVKVWWVIYDSEDNIVAQGTTSETVNVEFGENDTQATRYINYRVEFKFGAPSNNKVLFKTVWLNVVQEAGDEPGPTPTGDSVTFVGTFVTAKGDLDRNVPSYDGGNWSVAYIDDDPTNVLPQGVSICNFETAGEHTITYVRYSEDLYMQDWFNNSDVVSVEASGTTAWGCHGNEYYQQDTSEVLSGNTQLTGVTFDENCGRIGSSCFSGCTSLVYLAFNNPNGVSFKGDTYPFDTITSNTGELHIPSGKTSEYSNIITALGQNWSTYDDL